MNFNACEIEPVPISLDRNGGLKLLVRESCVAGLIPTIHLLGLLVLAHRFGSPLTDVSEQFV